MKKLILLFSIMVWCGIAGAQAPQLINYQAVIRDANNEVIENKNVSIQLAILKTHSVGIQVYQEEHRVTTNSFGLVNLQIGAGSNKVGSLSDVDWGTDVHVLKVSIDQSGGSAFQVMGYAQLVSVPYALYAANVSYSDTSATNELQMLSFSNDTLRLSNGNSVYLPSKDYSKDISDLNDSIVVINSRLISIQQQVRNDSIFLAGLINNHISTDQDVDSLNEIQNLSISGNTLTISKGNSVILPGGAAQSNDNDSTNELISVVSFVGSTLSITDAGGTKSANLSALLDNTDAQTLSLSGNVLSIGGGNSVTLPSGSINNDNDSTNELNSQVQFSGNVLTITDAGGSKSANLSSLLDNTDSQTLILSGNTLSISGGNSVTLPAGGALNNDNDSTNEIQSLSRSSDTLFISKSNYVVLPTGSVNTDDQNLSLSGDTLYIENGSPVILTKYLNTDAQNLTLLGNTLSISGGNSVTLPAGGAPNNDNDSTNELQTLNLTGNTLSISKGNSVTLASGAVNHDNDSTNELITSVLLSNDTLSITDAGGTKSVSLSTYLDNTDAQMLSLSGDTIYLSNGGFVKLPAATSGFDGDSSSTNELQNLTLKSDTLAISNGNFVVLPSGTVNTDDQNLTLSGDTLSIEDGNFVVLTSTPVNNDNDSTNELQAISISNDTIYLSNGGFVKLPSSNSSDTLSLIRDADNDTKIQVEESTDEDIIRFDLGGTERWLMRGNALVPSNPGGNVLVGKDAGLLSNSGSTFNVLLGYETGRRITTGDYNTVVGADALVNASTSSGSSVFGMAALQRSTAGDNDAFGMNALNRLTTGTNNTAFGRRSLFLNVTGINNTAFGRNSGLNNLGSNNVFLGYEAGALDTNGSHKLYIENSFSNRPLIYGEFDNDSLRFNSAVEVRDELYLPSGAGAGKVLTSDANGKATWQNVAGASPNLDNDSTNEIQNLSISGSTLSISNGNSITLPAGGGPNYDNDSTNELNSSLALSGTTLTITDAGGAKSANLSSINTDNQTLSLSGNTLSISGGNNVTLPANSVNNDNDSTNEIQTLTLTGNTLSISNGNSVTLASGTVNNDNDSTNELNTSVSVSGNILSITDAGGSKTADLSAFKDNTDSQTLSVSGSTLTISGGNSVTLPAGSVNNDNDSTNELNTAFTLSSNNLTITDAAGAKTVNLAGYLDNTDAQTLSLSGNTLSITGGNNVTLPSGNAYTTKGIDSVLTAGSNAAGLNMTNLGALDVNNGITASTIRLTTGAGANKILTSDASGNASWQTAASISLGDTTQIADLDGDTKIMTEESSDEDIIRFDLAGTERWIMQSTRIEPAGTGGSVFIGLNAGQNDDLTNNNNTFLGNNSGQTTTTGYYNVGVGRQAMLLNSTGRENTSVGGQALYSNTSGWRNASIGYQSMYSNQTGIANTAMGSRALRSNSNTSYNSAFGYDALYSNSSTGNTALGSFAGRSLVTGAYNAVVGYAALFSNVTGARNVAVGTDAMRTSVSGSNNTVVGQQALYRNINGNNNVVLGRNAGFNNSTGSGNVLIGYQAGYSETGSNKLYIDNSNTTSPLIYGDFSSDEVKVNGDLEVRDDLVIPTGAGAGKLLTSDANGKASWTVPGAVSLGDTTQVSDIDGDTKIQMEESTDEDIMRFDIAGTEQWVMKGARLESYNSGRSVFIGEQAGQNDDLSNNDNVFVGYRSGRDNTTGAQNTAIGGNALRNNTTGRYNTATGYSALWLNTIGQQNSAYGYYALGANTSGSYNSAFGLGALRLNNTGRFNTATGYYALNRNATGEYNAALGASALRLNTTGFRNAALGYASLYFNTTGFRNVGTGMYTLYRNTTGYDNVASGYYSSGFTTTGYENAAIGANSLFQNTTGSRNAALGFRAGYYGQTGVQNTYVGSYAGSASGTNFSNVTALGYNTRTTASNQVRVGNSSVTSIGGQVGWTTISDGRFKENVKSDVAGIDFIMKLEPVTYTLKTEEIFEQLENADSLETYGSNTTDRLEKSKTVQSGFIAQDVEKAAKELGYSFSGVDAPKNDQDIYGLRYSEFVVPLVKAMQEQQEMINKQQELIEQLEQRIKSLER